MRTVSLPRSVDITVVQRVAGELVDALIGSELTIDAGAVAKVDAAGLQLLCAAAAAARAQGIQLRWKDVPAALTEGARILALTAPLGLPQLRLQESR